MNLHEKIDYYLEIIRYYINNNILCRISFYLTGNLLILYLSYKASLKSMKYVTMDSIRFHKNMLHK